MRVLLLHKFLHVKGGAELFVFETARALQNAGHEVAFMSTRDERNVVTPWNRYFPTAPPFRSENALVRGACLPQIVYSRSAKKATRDLVRPFKPDIAHAFNIYTHLSPSVLDACREEGVPVVMTCNDYKHICPNLNLSRSHSVSPLKAVSAPVKR